MKQTFTQRLQSYSRFRIVPGKAIRKAYADYTWAVLAFCSLISVSSFGQTSYPTLTNYSKPSPEVAAPGDAFTPPMSGTAVNAAPQAGEWTRTAGPDESIVLTGVNFSRFSSTDEGKDSRFLVYGRNGAQKEARIQRVEMDKAIITLPKDLTSWSMYLIWPGNEAGYGSPIAVNKTDAWWVGPDKAIRGQSISVFGRNLAQNNDTLRSYVYVKPVGGSGQWATVTRVNPYKVDFTVPAGFGNGEYEVWTHNGHGGQYGWSGPQKLTIYNGPQWTTTVFNVKNYGATGNGYTDDTQAIRNALLAAKNSPGSTVYFPTGVYMMSNNVPAYSNIQLKGDGQDKTILKCATNYSTSAMAMIIGVVQNFAMSDMTFAGNGNFRGSLDKPIFLRGSTDVWITNVRFSFAGFNILDLHNCRYVYLNKTEHIGIATFLGDGSQLFIDRNSFKLTNDTDMPLHTWSGVGISMTRSTCKDLDNSNPLSGAGWGKGRFFVGNGSWGSNRNTYLGENITTDLTPRPGSDVDQNSGEQFLWEGNLAQWGGYVSSSTATSTTFPGYSNTAPNKEYAVIVKGRGIGQSRRIVSNNGGTVTLNEPWNVNPDASSYVVIGHFIDRIAVYNNYLDGKPRAVTSPEHIAAAGIEPYGGSLNFIAANNTLHELRQGIANWSTQHDIGLDPNFFSLYTNNKMVNCRWGIYNQLILSRAEGTTVMGTTYRNNNIQSATVSGIHTSVSTSASNSLEAEIYEHNSFSNVPQGLTSAVGGVMNQMFYKNNFSSIGGYGLTITPKMALRENIYQGVSTLYKGSLKGTTVEAPLHVIDMSGVAGGSPVTTDFTLKNSAITPMNWVATSSAAWLSLNSGSGTIPDERSVNLIGLNANPVGLAAGTHIATITVTVAEQTKKYTVVLKLSAAQNNLAITAPAANKVFAANEPVNITANATDTNASISKVEFFAGAVKLGEDLTSPYSYNWTNTTPGTYNLTVKATNSAGTVTTSAPVNITVTNNAAPTVSITSPGAATTFAAPATITINANAADTDGSISKVEFFNGSVKLGEDVTSPYSFNWYNVEVGSYVIIAKATDNAGTTTTSAPVTISSLVATAPTVVITSPGINNSIKAPTNVHITANAELTNGHISRVEFFNGATKLGEKTHEPFEIYWMNAPTGSFTITAKATGNNGTISTSAPVNITIVSSSTPINAVPAVSITSPTATTSLASPANISINANATDADGTISKVEFFYGTIKLGEDTTSPFSFMWNNVLADTYSLTARATDNAGATTTSAPVLITVTTSNTTSNSAPSVNLTSPTATTAFTAPANITMAANAADWGGSITKVEFFNGSVKLGEDLTSPYTYTWSSAPAGSYSLTARATDNAGASTTSAAVNILVSPSLTPVAPTVVITSPTSSSVFAAPASVNLTANATDTDGSIVRVDFFNGSTLLGTATTSPYSFTWNNVAAGSYAITARATDNTGLTATSAPVSVNVSAPVLPVAPTVAITSPTTGTTLTPPANLVITANAADADGKVSKVEFYNGPTLLGTATTSPYSFTWSNIAAGTYTLTAKATDNTGLVTTSSAVSVTVAIPYAPTVTITSPTNTAKFATPINITITASAADTDGRVAKVEFFNGTVLLGTSTTSPYSFTWNNIPDGTHALTAKATDNSGLSTTSATVNITAKAPVGPTVAITSPVNAASFTAPATVAIAANAADTDGSIIKVEFFNGTTKLGEDLTSPYTYNWGNVATGTYTLTAKAYDNTGLTSTSTAVTIAVKAPVILVAPTVALTSPVVGSSYTAPGTVFIGANASDTDGNVVKVEFYQGTIKLGEDITSPYSFSWSNVAAGTYSITAKAIDNSGLSSSSSLVNITVNNLVAPMVSITSPVNAASFTAPATISITANASDADGTVSKVEFFNGTTLLGTATTSPYGFTWSNAPAGMHTLTARATDNHGLVTASKPVSISVGAAPTPVASAITITSPVAGTTFNGLANIVINTSVSTSNGLIQKVEFFANNKKIGLALNTPYSINWNSVAIGTYSLTAVVTNRKGQSSTSPAVEITVGSGARTAGLMATGGISWDYWTNMPGWHNLSQIPVNDTPAGSKVLTSFVSPKQVGNNYGARIRGYVVPPTTGAYTFYLSGDDQADLFLSSSEDPAQKVIVAYLSNATKLNDFNNHATQKSKSVILQAGQRYYIEALHKEGTGNDFVSVGWKLPNSTTVLPVAGAYLMPYNTGTNLLAIGSLNTAIDSNKENQVSILSYPNPTENQATIEFTFTKDEDYKLQIFDLKGKLMATLKTGKAKAGEEIKVNWEAGNLPKGIYNATLTSNSTTKTTRIVLQ